MKTMKTFAHFVRAVNKADEGLDTAAVCAEDLIQLLKSPYDGIRHFVVFSYEALTILESSFYPFSNFIVTLSMLTSDS